MKKRFLIALLLLLFLSTYKMQENFQLNKKLNIKEIIIENNSIIQNSSIEKSLSLKLKDDCIDLGWNIR